MPPKQAATPAEEFLAKCFKHMVEKPTVNFDTLAQEIGMSKGGAANKFRAIMNKYVEDGAIWSQNGDSAVATASPPATPSKNASVSKRKASVKNATKSNATDDLDADDDNDAIKADKDVDTADGGSAIDEPPKKKAKAKVTPKKAAKGAINGKGSAKAVLNVKPEEVTDDILQEAGVKTEAGSANGDNATVAREEVAGAAPDIDEEQV